MQHLSDIERGRKDPSSEVSAAVTGALGLSLGDLAIQVAQTVRVGSQAETAVVLDLSTGNPVAHSRSAPVSGQINDALCAAA
ncbi:hypothetical protein BJY26_000852 [Spelaeicoccus albus]|uniref:HTH cro/C1-type domain-containing protein n=2 Tax=Spelaeicoccus albus TaxID=1280376 RepID=A0A7Z0ACA0_9MICO|nr:hypothetical protein [Spelaeicoccus albus]